MQLAASIGVPEKERGAWEGVRSLWEGLGEHERDRREQPVNTQHGIQISAMKLSEGNKTSSGDSIDC